MSSLSSPFPSSSSSLTSLISTMASTITPFPTSSLLPDSPAADRSSYLSSTTTSLIACIMPMIGLMYMTILSWTYHHGQKNPRPINKSSGVWVQRYAPVVYVFIVMISLIEVSITSWLLLQYRFNSNYPNTRTRAGVRLLLFASSWTSLTAGTYSLLFLHPAWSRHPVSSVGAQLLWIFLTWWFWVVGAGIVNSSVPALLDRGTCAHVVYCAQIRGLFGAVSRRFTSSASYLNFAHSKFPVVWLSSSPTAGVAVLQSLTLTGGMLAMLWLAWQSARYSLKRMSESFRLR